MYTLGFWGMFLVVQKSLGTRLKGVDVKLYYDEYFMENNIDVGGCILPFK